LPQSVKFFLQDTIPFLHGYQAAGESRGGVFARGARGGTNTIGQVFNTLRDNSALFVGYPINANHASA
jgi:hypothetical protein